MRLPLFAMFVALLLSSAAARADDTCPALNRARASAALQADATLAVEWRGASDYTCTYTAGTAGLRVTIAPYHARQGWPSYSARCFSASDPVTGIGNEGVVCAKDGTAEILSHVRDTYFEVQLTGTDPATRSERLRHAAEIVASNLF